MESKFEHYYQHLKEIHWSGRVYKRFLTSPLLYLCARRFGINILEVGSGTGNGVLGAYPKKVTGIDINPLAIEFSIKSGLNAKLINKDGTFPLDDSSFDVCILDNVLEHIENPKSTLDECWRVTNKNSGMIIVVPGERGFNYDTDHKIYYNEKNLTNLDSRWILINLFSIPFFFLNPKLSKTIKQYCLVAVYKKASSNINL